VFLTARAQAHSRVFTQGKSRFTKYDLHSEKPSPLTDEDAQDKSLLSQPPGVWCHAQSLGIGINRAVLQRYAMPH